MYSAPARFEVSMVCADSTKFQAWKSSIRPPNGMGCLRKGFAIGEIRSSLDRYGHVLYSAATRNEAIARCELAASLVCFEFEDGDSRNGVGTPW